MKKLLNKIKKQPKGPRSLADIQKEYQQVSSQAASIQYQVYANTKNLEGVNARLAELHKEATEREKLDAEVKAELDKKNAETKPAQVTEDVTQSGAV